MRLRRKLHRLINRTIESKTHTVKLEKNFFKLFELPQQFDTDSVAMKRRFRVLQRNFHPDRYIGKPPQEHRLAVQLSAHINTAFATLSDPVKRAEHLLNLQGIEIDHQQSTIKDNVFLLKQMEFRETLEQAAFEKDRLALSNILTEVSDDFKVCQIEFAKKIVNLNSTESQSLTDSLCNEVSKMYFYQSLSNELNTNIRLLSQ